MNNLSNERLEKIASWREKYGYGHNVVIPAEEAEVMARELLALREAQREPVAWDYEWASCITCEGPRNFKRVIEREAPPEWAIDEGQARKIILLYAAPQLPAVPDGWVMVPMTPTAEMRMNGIEAAANAMRLIEECPTRHCWRAMIAAAPKPE